MFARDYACFVTMTCLNWEPVLKDKRCKEIIITSLEHLVSSERIHLYAFVLMDTHIHLIWQMRGVHQRQHVQRDFLKFTSHEMLTILKEENNPLNDRLLVNSKDRRYQVWKRRALSIPVFSEGVVLQKLDYIHNNPVLAELCKHPADYYYSSASFYYRGDSRWKFLTHIDG